MTALSTHGYFCRDTFARIGREDLHAPHDVRRKHEKAHAKGKKNNRINVSEELTDEAKCKRTKEAYFLYFLFIIELAVQEAVLFRNRN